ncbi:MAG: hypothetical protein LBQ01_06900 [Prevotellaceae bacterium]|jgi:hypothetical protein|nr:hypothetical protein [Prevotellaceae bacterium]
MDEKEKVIMNGNEELAKAVKKLGINLVEMVAETSIWASPEFCEQLKQKNGDAVYYLNVRRGRSDEMKGDTINGIRIDDNTYANNAIKRAVGLKRKDIRNYETCHIWEDTCYDERYHTAIPNLVLVPSAIASLSDHSDEIINALKYRSYELYGWYPKERSKPQKPCNYPDNWQEPAKNAKIKKTGSREQEEQNIVMEIKSNVYIDKIRHEIDKVMRRVPKWLNNSEQFNSTILINFLKLLDDNSTKVVSLQNLKNRCNMATFKIHVTDMSNISDKGHGKVFEITEDGITLWEPVASFILDEWNNHPELH